MCVRLRACVLACTCGCGRVSGAGAAAAMEAEAEKGGVRRGGRAWLRGCTDAMQQMRPLFKYWAMKPRAGDAIIPREVGVG
jgi:hypothetical protein